MRLMLSGFYQDVIGSFPFIDELSDDIITAIVESEREKYYIDYLEYIDNYN